MEVESPTALDIATLVIAVFGAVVAMMALGWQVASWLLSGGRAKVELRNGAIHERGDPYVTVPADKAIGSDLVTQGFTRRAIFINVRNVGRLPISVTGWHLKFPAAMTLGEMNHPRATFPHRLEVGESKEWHIEVDTDVQTILRAAQRKAKVSDVEVRGVVELGNGKKTTTRQKIVFPASDLE